MSENKKGNNLLEAMFKEFESSGELHTILDREIGDILTIKPVNSTYCNIINQYMPIPYVTFTHQDGDDARGAILVDFEESGIEEVISAAEEGGNHKLVSVMRERQEVITKLREIFTPEILKGEGFVEGKVVKVLPTSVALELSNGFIVEVAFLDVYKREHLDLNFNI